MNVKIHAQGIKGSGMIDPGQQDEASVLFNCILEVDGHIIDEVSKIELVMSGGEFAIVKAHLIPGTFEIVTHDKDSWPAMLRSLDEQREIRAGSGRMLAES